MYCAVNIVLSSNSRNGTFLTPSIGKCPESISVDVDSFADQSGRAVFARSNTKIVISNLTRGLDVCMRSFCVCVVLCR
jgi:hypothetical protein